MHLKWHFRNRPTPEFSDRPDRLDYLSEAEKQLGDKSIYNDVSFNDKILRELVETSNKMFLNLKRKGSIIRLSLPFFSINLITACF